MSSQYDFFLVVEEYKNGKWETSEALADFYCTVFESDVTLDYILGFISAKEDDDFISFQALTDIQLKPYQVIPHDISSKILENLLRDLAEQAHYTEEPLPDPLTFDFVQSKTQGWMPWFHFKDLQNYDWSKAEYELKKHGLWIENGKLTDFLKFMDHLKSLPHSDQMRIFRVSP